MAKSTENASGASPFAVKSVKVQRAAESVLRKYEAKYDRPKSFKDKNLSWVKTPRAGRKSA
ncbi:hypothetical protein AUR04nite_01080 [Glutamicibacter uratoxydans]|uniref:Uncharacterized protein n=1 Tax=Glutamicibacter uratoxydans TaxID=43667 RepID=A0A4Y4DHR9_GLUUR|nr:hypothetical protein [Glutamicibacter uratoxydans]GED04576.1 hypothetical protein AUR04nite_01080 [Glutamicibacter uratoxydans]